MKTKAASMAKKFSSDDQTDRERRLAESMAQDFFKYVESHRVEAGHKGFQVLYENEDLKTGLSSVICLTCLHKLREMDIATNLRDQVIEKFKEMLQEGSRKLELEEASGESQ